jgi:rhodanese-related sulfurtransferase
MEHEEEEEYVQPPQAQPVNMEIDDNDVQYLDLRDNHEFQAYAMIKNRVFQNTWQIDPNLLEKIGMDTKLYIIRQVLGGSCDG